MLQHLQSSTPPLRSPEVAGDRSTPIVVHNPNATDQSSAREYLERLRATDRCTPLVVETDPNPTETGAAVVSAIEQYMTRHEGAAPGIVTYIGGDKTFADAIVIAYGLQQVLRQILHQPHEQPGSDKILSPAELALAVAAIGPVHAGNGNDFARHAHGGRLPKEAPLPWEWSGSAKRHPIELDVHTPGQATSRFIIASYFGLGGSTKMMRDLLVHRAEWAGLSGSERLRREFSLALELAREEHVIVNGHVLASYDVACSSVMAKHINTGVDPSQRRIKVAETEARSPAGVAIMAARLAVGMTIPGAVVERGSFYIGSSRGDLHVDGDVVGTLDPGTTGTFRSSDISVTVATGRLR